MRYDEDGQLVECDPYCIRPNGHEDQCRDEPTDHEIYNRFGVEGGIAYDTRPREEF